MKHVVICGDKYVGKTALLRRLTKNSYTDSYLHTITKNFGRVEPNILLYDTTGSERFQYVCNPYYQLADAAIVVFDVTVPSSYEHVVKWKRKIKELNTKQIPIFVIGNKIDLKDVKIQENIKYISCKENTNINLRSFFTSIRVTASVGMQEWLVEIVANLSDATYQRCQIS